MFSDLLLKLELFSLLLLFVQENYLVVYDFAEKNLKVLAMQVNWRKIKQARENSDWKWSSKI